MPTLSEVEICCPECGYTEERWFSCLGPSAASWWVCKVCKHTIRIELEELE